MSTLVGRACAAGLLFPLALGLSAPAFAAPTSLELVFEQPYLSKLEPGTTLSYRFVRTADDKTLEPSFEDDVRMGVVQDGDSKSVRIDLFTGNRAKSIGPMSIMGNPVIIAVLEQDVNEMQKLLGGSPYYIRNRIKEAIVSGDNVQPTKIDYDGRTVDGWKVSFKPFENDAQRAKLKAFVNRSYEMTFSDDVPGGLYKLETVTPKADGGAGAMLVENLTLTGVAATEAKPQ